MQALQVKEDQQKRAATAANLKKLESEIYSDVDSPVLGSEQADVSIVVFYDYFCGYCKKTLPELQAFLAKNPMVKVIYKEFPILGEASILAAKAALAAGRQGKFEAFHRAMLETNAGTDEAIKAIAERLGLDYARLHKDMNDPKTVAAIERNIRLADALNINGTPAYLIGSQVVPGAIDTAALSRMVNDERAKLANANKDKSAAKGLN